MPLLLFNYVGFELQNGAAEEMQNPQRDVPVTVLQSGIVTVLAYSIPVFGILAVLPASQITGIGGFLDAVHTTFSVYGGAQNFLTDVMVFGFIFALVTSGAVWMMGSDRILAVAAYDGAFPGYFGRFHARLGTPVRVNVMSGVTSTIFMLAAVYLLSGSASAANTFTVVLYLATSTTLLSYLLIFPAAIKLRMSHGNVPRPYRLGKSGNGLMWVCTILCTAWMALGSWVAIFPGTLERLTGHSLQHPGHLRRDQAAVRGVHARHAGGYPRVRRRSAMLLAADVRAKAVEVPLDTGLEPVVGRLSHVSGAGAPIEWERSGPRPACVRTIACAGRRSASRATGATPSWTRGRSMPRSSPRATSRASASAGGRALVLPPDPLWEDDPADVLDLLDGLVVAGGEDVGTDLYGHEPHPRTGPKHHRRDARRARAAARRRSTATCRCSGSAAASSS